MRKIWTPLTILIGAMSITSLISQWGAIGLNSIVADFVGWYQKISSWPFGWTTHLGFRVPQWLCDYFALGVLVEHAAKGSVFTTWTINGSVFKSTANFVRNLLGVTIWPLILIFETNLFAEPSKERRRFSLGYASGSLKYKLEHPLYDADGAPLLAPHDMRNDISDAVDGYIKGEFYDLRGRLFRKRSVQLYFRIALGVIISMGFFAWSAYGPSA